MSFSQEVKAEIAEKLPADRHCMAAELYGLFVINGLIRRKGEKKRFLFETENQTAARICFTLSKKACRMCANIRVSGTRNLRFTLAFEGRAAGELSELLLSDLSRSERRDCLLRQSCCKKAFLKGCFLAAGSVSDPNRSYHLEFISSNREAAETIQSVLDFFGLHSGIVGRKNSFITYIKDGGDIVTALNLMEAPKALLNMENVRILKEVRGSVNRRVNCETANITKTVDAAQLQIKDIEFIRESAGLHTLSKSLREAADIRLRYPDASLTELGAFLDPPVGKSGMNHRFRKLRELAENIRNQRQDENRDRINKEELW
ncbi:MAG: DNA-binding protein WhiA [Lachnospiraceae bacterium]|nr:DNA-binding protein WhiA [Lachnospiraceae bacterium]